MCKNTFYCPSCKQEYIDTIPSRCKKCGFELNAVLVGLEKDKPDSVITTIIADQKELESLRPVHPDRCLGHFNYTDMEGQDIWIEYWYAPEGDYHKLTVVIDRRPIAPIDFEPLAVIFFRWRDDDATVNIKLYEYYRGAISFARLILEWGSVDVSIFFDGYNFVNFSVPIPEQNATKEERHN